MRQLISEKRIPLWLKRDDPLNIPIDVVKLDSSIYTEPMEGFVKKLFKLNNASSDRAHEGLTDCQVTDSKTF
ncbi:hypothetical protein CEXT_331751 [Caerostris extrusa]|uniref:Uncharacterized protein n=1 Tax=Caerostris extrusa TaxID=172846 RepID=A0AAV4TGR3_CAEEX|nr:hypothetical protein CEXT_331751 [Caerostris extrusa]